MAPIIHIEATVERLVTVDRARDGAYRHMPIYILLFSNAAKVETLRRALL